MIGKYLNSNLYMFVSVFNYVCLNGFHPKEMQGCWHKGGLIKLLTFCSQAANLVNLSLGCYTCFLSQNNRIYDATHE